MGLLDRAKSVAEQATTKAKEEIGEAQTRRELGKAYDELGKLTYELVEAQAVTNDRLQPVVARIHELEAQLKREQS
jgi:hypothetical protein